MAVSLINIGNIANDGTGDDLREAFIKVNTNFEELDLRQPESTTASNLGSVGQGIFFQKNENDLEFKRLAAGNNVTLTATNDTITVNALGGLQSLLLNADSGSISLADGDSITIQGGNTVTTSINSSSSTLSIDAQTVLSSDSSPTLGADLDAANFNINNAGDISGSLQGLVYGVDVRELNRFFTVLDFGTITGNITNWVDFIKATYSVDFGGFTDPADFDVDLGTF